MSEKQWKKIHLNDAKCLNLSRSEEGSRSLRGVVQIRKPSTSNHLSPREVSEHWKFDHCGRNNLCCSSKPATTGVHDAVDKCQSSQWDTVSDDVRGLACVEVEDNMSVQNTGFQLASQLMLNNTASVFPKKDFISAKQLMKPAHNLLYPTESESKNKALENSTERHPVLSMRRKSKSSNFQKNNLDKYFTRLPAGSCPAEKISMPLSDNEDFKDVLPAKKKQKICGRKKEKSKTKPTALLNVQSFSDEQNDTMSSWTSSDFSANTFGLFGLGENELIELSSSSDSEAECKKINHFSRLPIEIMENIFCRLPFMDLHLSANRVCTDWNDLINSPMFMPWKKMYCRLLKGEKESFKMMAERMKADGMNLIELYLPSLIRSMKLFKPDTARGSISDSLKKHPKYSLATDLLMERFKDCMIRDQVPNPWCTIASLIILSDSVKDIEQIIKCSLGGQSDCLASTLIDCLYHIASFLWMFKTLRFNDVWTGMHYRLYYALYLYENESVSTVGELSQLKEHSGQQSIYRYTSADAVLRLTNEQMRICNHHVHPGQIIKIVAFAGTGKTTTLLQYTQMRPSTNFLLVVYNKSVCDNVKSRFPQNVVCRTGHSLAFREVGFKYKNKLTGNVRVSDVVNHLQTRKGLSLFIQAKFVVDTLNKFMASADPFITTAHVPTAIMKEDGKMHSIDHDFQMKLADDAENIWKKMIDLQSMSMKLPHDGYLKLWQLRKPKLSNYDVILVDEAQDLTPALTDVLLNQLQSKILVGDPHQQIYAFRGAVNTMNMISPSHTFYLTQSFRFGPEISFVAYTCLELYKKETRKILVGNGISGGVCGDQVGKLAIIARSNYHLFNEMVKKCSYSDDPIKVGFAGGFEGYGFEMIEDMYALLSGTNTECIRHPLIKCFISKGFAELDSYAQKTLDIELLGKIRIVKRYGHTLQSHIQQIRKKCVFDPIMADVIFSTAHKAKGLEFDTVLICDDFLTEGTPGIHQTGEDEFNLMYVAVTRAKKRLIMSPTVITALSRAGENFDYLVSTKQLTKENIIASPSETSDDSPFACKAATSVSTAAVTVIKKTIRRSDGLEIKSMVYDPASVFSDMPSLRGIAGLPLL